MESILCPGVVYSDIQRDISEHDLDVISDLWTVDGRDVYRGSRDPAYSHANVYWLYSESFERLGLSEHDKQDPAVFRSLWYRDSDFGTFLQEDGWTADKDIWSVLPRHVFDKLVNEETTTPDQLLEVSLRGPVRILTASMLQRLPTVYTCTRCESRSLTRRPGCLCTEAPLDLPALEKVLFVDDDCIVQRPPPESSVWLRLERLRHDGGSSQPLPQQPQVQEPEQAQVLRTELSPPPAESLPPQPQLQ